jgi:hypothetical protein
LPRGLGLDLFKPSSLLDLGFGWKLVKILKDEVSLGNLKLRPYGIKAKRRIHESAIEVKNDPFIHSSAF